jgi:hypothetical protein
MPGNASFMIDIETSGIIDTSLILSAKKLRDNSITLNIGKITHLGDFSWILV